MSAHVRHRTAGVKVPRKELTVWCRAAKNVPALPSAMKWTPQKKNDTLTGIGLSGLKKKAFSESPPRRKSANFTTLIAAGMIGRHHHHGLFRDALFARTYPLGPANCPAPGKYEFEKSQPNARFDFRPAARNPFSGLLAAINCRGIREGIRVLIAFSQC